MATGLAAVAVVIALVPLFAIVGQALYSLGTWALAAWAPAGRALLPAIASGRLARDLSSLQTQAGHGRLGAPVAVLLAGTAAQVGAAIVLSVPGGIAAGALLAGTRPSRSLAITEELFRSFSSIPPFAAGLIVLVLWAEVAGQGRSGLAVAIALSVLVLPAVTVTTMDALRAAPEGLTEAAVALGARRRDLLRLALPGSGRRLSAIASRATGRAVGESAPVLLAASAAQGASGFLGHGAPGGANLAAGIFLSVTSGTDLVRSWLLAGVLLCITGAFYLVAIVAEDAGS
ncbi:MAG: ABC transporter permease subunit [Acidimicrobiales bacterium]